ncbi:MAG: trigger factor, partial [Thermoguttaceae bacterium]|nr:trigger factor [Thermoguttaceae bacterium]
MLMAAQSGESPRRIRAQIEKSGNMDVLRNQIIERKVIALIQEAAEFTEVPFEFEAVSEEAIDRAAATTAQDDIPEVSEEEVKEVARNEAQAR